MEKSDLKTSPGISQRNGRLLELLVFLFLILPSMAFSFTMMSQTQPSFPVSAGSTILRDLSLLALILFFLWRNGEPVVTIGWQWKTKPLLEASIGIVFFPAAFFLLAWVERLLNAIGISAPSAALNTFVPSGFAQIVLALVLIVVVAVTEETIFRGYLFARLDAVTGNRVAAIVLSSVIFSLGHGYEGLAGVINAAFLGVLLEMLYLWRRSLIAPMIIHFLQDFLAILVLPHLVK